MTKPTATIEFKVVASPKGLVFQYKTPDGNYYFSNISLSGYYGELALPVTRNDTIEFIRDGGPLTKQPMVVWATGREGHDVYLQHAPEALKTREPNEIDFLDATKMNEDDVVKCHINASNPRHPVELLFRDQLEHFIGRTCVFIPK